MLTPPGPLTDEHTVLQQLRELVDARLIVAVTAEAFAFRHALTREAVYATLLKRQRAAFHALVAETVERIYDGEATPSEHAADLAYHYREAANWPKALEYAQRAGQQAQARYAPHEAAEHFTRAIEAAGQIGQAPDLGLLRDRGQALEILGDFERARADFELGLSLARADGAAQAEWQALLDLGFLWAGRDYGRTGEYLQQALALARAAGDPLTIAHSLNRVGNWLLNTGREEEALQHHREALEIFRDQGSWVDMAATYELLGLVHGLSGDIAAAKQRVEQAIELFRRVGDKRGLIESLVGHSTLVTNCDTLPWPDQTLQSCRQEAAEALDVARQIGWLAGQAEVQWLLAGTLAAYGEFGEALARANAAMQTASDIDHREWMAATHCTLGQIYLWLLEPEAALRHFGIARPLTLELGSIWLITYSSAYTALAQVQLGQAQAARDVLQSAAAVLGLETDWQARPPRSLLGRYVHWAWAETTLADGQPAVALEFADRLIDSAINPGGEPIPNLLKLKGEALMALDQPAEAQAPLDLALQGARQHRARPILWQVHRDRARLAQRLGRPDESRLELAAARAVLEDLAGTLDEGPIKQAFLGRAMGQVSGNW